MSFRKAFVELLRTGRRRRTIEESPYGKPGVFENDAAFMLKAQALGKWGDVVYAGPGASEAEERRRQSLGLSAKVDPVATEPARKKRRLSKAEKLRAKLERLQADVEKLEKGGK